MSQYYILSAVLGINGPKGCNFNQFISYFKFSNNNILNWNLG